MMTFNNLLECSFWENLNFVCFRFQGCWEQDGSRWWYFLRKILNKCEKVDFAQIRHFSIAEMEKASSKSSIKEETYYTTKVLNCNRWTAIWSLLVPKITDQTNQTLHYAGEIVPSLFLLMVSSTQQYVLSSSPFNSHSVIVCTPLPPLTPVVSAGGGVGHPNDFWKRGTSQDLNF